MKTIFKNENWKPCLVLFFIWKKIIYLFIASLYNCITLTVQRKCTKCTKVYKTTLCEILQSIMNHSFIFLSLTNCTHMLCTLFNSHMKIPILFPIMIYGEIFFDLKSSTIFSTKPLELWLNTLMWTHNLEEIWNLRHCTRKMY